MISIDIIFSRDKSYRSSKDVIASVLRGEQLPEWDVGAYLVGVFACRPLTSDSQAYAEDKGQWPHCRFKEKWEAALQGKDTFAEKDRALIIAGAELALDTRLPPHGWGIKVLSHPHVQRLLESWGSPIATSTLASREAEILMRKRHKDRPLHNRNETSEEHPSSRKALMSPSMDDPVDPIAPIINPLTNLNLYEAGKEWLIELALKGFPVLSREQVEVLVELHLDPRNYTLDCITDYERIFRAIIRGENCEQVSKLLAFEDVSTLLGVYRVHCRNLLNRQGISDVKKGGSNPTKNPMMLAFLDSLTDSIWHGFDRSALLCDRFLEVASRSSAGVFSQDDIDSFNNARQLGDGLFATSTADAGRYGIKQGWLKVLKGMCGGVNYLKRFNMDVGQFHEHISQACKTYRGTISLLNEYRTIPEVGEALAPNFFGDLGYKEFCKPDVHVCAVINGLEGTNYNEQHVFERMLLLAQESSVPPRQLDKVFYLVGSGNFYLVGKSIGDKKNSSQRRNGLVKYLRQSQSVQSRM